MTRRQAGRSRTAGAPRRAAATLVAVALVIAAGLLGGDTNHHTTSTAAATGTPADTRAGTTASAAVRVVVKRAQPRDDRGTTAPAAHLAGMHHNPTAQFSVARLSGTRFSVSPHRTAPARPVAEGPGVVLAQAASVDQVLTNIRNLILGLAGGFVLVCWSVAGTRYLLSQGDPSETERAKSAFRAGAYGFGLVILAPLGVTILRGIVGV